MSSLCPAPRQGSILLFCIGLMLILVGMAFAFVRTISLHADASQTSERNWLCQEAARQGLNHALEQILRHSSATKGSGTMDGYVTAPDGIWNLPFRPLHRDLLQSGPHAATNFPGSVYQTLNVTNDHQYADDNVRLEYPMDLALMGDLRMYTGYETAAFTKGVIYQPRVGRFFEVGVANPYPQEMNPSGAGVSSGAWASPRFIPGPAGSDDTTLGQLDTVGRFGGVWLDPRLRRVGYGALGSLMPTSAAEAKNARKTPQHRFRMRYAVMTEDLSGNLLMFPEAEPALTASQSPDYRAVWRPGVNNKRLKDQSTNVAIADSANLAEPILLASQKSPTATNNVALDWARWAGDAPRGERLMRWSPAFFDVLHMAGMDPTRLAMSLRHEHVYQLRGSVINQARINDDVVNNNNDPVTFPWMFRCTYDPDNTTWINTPALNASFASASIGYGRASLAATSGSSIGTGVTSWQTILPQGGRVIDSSTSKYFGLLSRSYAVDTHRGNSNTRLPVMEHNLVGIVPSWSAVMAAAMGGGPDFAYYPVAHKLKRENEFFSESNHLTLNMVTPFGRGVDNKVAGTAASKTYRWHDAGPGGSDATIAVNAITALPAVIGGLIYSTLPPPVIAQQATIEQFLPCTGLATDLGTPQYGAPVTARQFFYDNGTAKAQASPYHAYPYSLAEYNGTVAITGLGDYTKGDAANIFNLKHLLFSAGGGLRGLDDFFTYPDRKWPTDPGYRPHYWLAQKGNLLFQSGEPLASTKLTWSLRDLWTSESQPSHLIEFLPPTGRGFRESISPPVIGPTTSMLFSGASLRPNYHIGDMKIRDDTFTVRSPGTNYPGMGCVTLDSGGASLLASPTTSAVIADDLGQYMRADQFCRVFTSNKVYPPGNRAGTTTNDGGASLMASTDSLALSATAPTCMPRDPYQLAPMWPDEGNTTLRTVNTVTLREIKDATNSAVADMRGRFTRKKSSTCTYTQKDNTSNVVIDSFYVSSAACEPPRAGIWGEIKPWGRGRLSPGGGPTPMSAPYSLAGSGGPLNPPVELYQYDQIAYKCAVNNMNYVEPNSGPLQCGYAMTQAITIFRTWFMLESSRFFNPIPCSASNPPNKRDRNWFTVCGFRGNTPTADGDKAKPIPRNNVNYTLEDLDAVFLRQLGINMDDLTMSAANVEPFGIGIDTTTTGFMCIFSPLPPAFKIPVNGVVFSATARQNLADLSFKVSSATPTRIEDPTKYPWAYSTSATEPRRLPVAYLSLGQVKLAILERVINDFRMSLLGASPDYDGSTDKLDGVTRPAFYPLDLDQDGRALCSAYEKRTSWYLGTGSGKLLFDSSLDPSVTESDINIKMTFYSLDRWEPVVGLPKFGRGPTRGSSAMPNFFSVAGVMLLRKSHFFRVWTRGELWDDLVQKPVAQVDMDSAVCVDPNGNGNHADDLTVLYQKQWVSRYNAQLSSPNN